MLTGVSSVRLERRTWPEHFNPIDPKTDLPIGSMFSILRRSYTRSEKSKLKFGNKNAEI